MGCGVAPPCVYIYWNVSRSRWSAFAVLFYDSISWSLVIFLHVASPALFFTHAAGQGPSGFQAQVFYHLHWCTGVGKKPGICSIYATMSSLKFIYRDYLSKFRSFVGVRCALDHASFRALPLDPEFLGFFSPTKSTHVHLKIIAQIAKQDTMQTFSPFRGP